MNEKEALKVIEQRRQEDPAFRRKYDAFLAKRSGKGKISDSDLEEVSGGIYDQTTCPKCQQWSLVTWSMGIYSYCTECDYTEWGRGWH